MRYGNRYDTQIGQLEIIEEEGQIVEIIFQKLENETSKLYEKKETEVIQETIKQIKQYLDGKREKFDIPMNPFGTEFRQKVWEELKKIPYGQTKTYGEIAALVGNKKASRAVGMANNKNPIPILIPCHRVIGSNQKLVGYAGGLEIKTKLLSIEKVTNLK